ncbi:energy transducer TonB [Chryseobacterium luquanense]|uniref:Energy transducer TonB n=1 Tax=Chryseobacterium luquanense TaxID=2983766 RepID=A0ABT3Y5N1_9FLAO|nr:hypothetical protein [Chryseobacterium luquanense]MCX8533386.1 energy transducer TonB [Chryseobacterium luquanense]
MKKYLILLSTIIFNGLIFGQEISSLPTPLSIPKEIENSLTATICHDFPDHEAYFPDGMEAFTKKIENLITLESVKLKKGENTHKAMLNFTVERDGSVKKVQVIGSNISFNLAVEKAMKRIKSKWIPAKHDRNFVRSIVKIPLTMNIE